MSVNSYLEDLAKKAIVRDDEKEGIEKSIETIFQRLKNYDSDKNCIGRNRINKYFIFGSYKRGIIIPREFDDNSDIDIMVVFGKKFKDSYGFTYTSGMKKPQTYLNYLKNFAESRYSRSEIHQSHPAIVLELNHIKFELVPAISDDFENFQIPTKQSSYQDWIWTNPNDLDGTLCGNQTLRKLVRIVKIWNAKQGYIYLSYELEKKIVSYNNYFNGNLANYFYSFCEILSINCDLPQWKIDKINTLKNKVQKAKIFDDSSEIESLFGVESGWNLLKRL